MPKFGYLVVEGPHDVEFAYRLLSPLGFSRVRMEPELDAFLRPLIPRSYPPDGDLQKRMPIPLFLKSSTHVIAVHSAIGDLSKMPYYNKAIVGTIASVLRPGKAVQTSIQDNRWFKDNSLSIEKVKAAQQFFKELFEI